MQQVLLVQLDQYLTTTIAYTYAHVKQDVSSSEYPGANVHLGSPNCTLCYKNLTTSPDR